MAPAVAPFVSLHSFVFKLSLQGQKYIVRLSNVQLSCKVRFRSLLQHQLGVSYYVLDLDGSSIFDWCAAAATGLMSLIRDIFWRAYEQLYVYGNICEI